jgi:hypothetical protein
MFSRFSHILSPINPSDGATHTEPQILDVHAHTETTPSLVIVKKETRAARPHKEFDVHISLAADTL